MTTEHDSQRHEAARGIALPAMELTTEQLAFLADLRTSARRATASLDASMIGPLIRANLVRWDDDPADAARRRQPPGSIFTLTRLGAQYLAAYEARCLAPN